jgi:2,3-bisphosphoglycerate-dependent phosphoglycerate mutase
MIEPTRVFLLRHGETAWNVERRLQGHLDVALNDVGRWQAAQLGRALQGEGLAAVYSSDLARSLDTARAVAQASGLPLHTDATLRERSFGRLEGLSYEEVEQHWPQDALHWRQREPDFRVGGGESLTTFSARSVAAVSACAAAHPGQAIAVVAHGGVLDCLYRAATGMGLQAARTWALGNASINRLLYHGEGFALVGWNDAAHLEPAAAEPNGGA